MSYIIVMKFLSWAFAWMLLQGFIFIKICESDLNDPNSKSDDLTKMGMQTMIEEFNNRSWAGRVVYTLFWGAVMMASPLELFKRKDDSNE